MSARQASDGGPAAAPAAGRAVPTGHVDRPYDRAGADLVEVEAVGEDDAGRTVLVANRLQAYTAAQWKARTGETIAADFRIVDDSPRTRRFVLRPDAVVYLDRQFHADDSAPRERVTAARFAARVQDVLDDGTRPTLWLFHSGGPDGPVTYVDDAAPELG